MAMMLVALPGTAAMAVDLGWLYWQSLEIQHGADAAALAGVVYEPDQRTKAHSAAVSAATTNGYDASSPGTTVSVIDFIDDATQVSHDDTGEADVRYSWQGENHYTLRTSTTSGDQPKLYAVGDMLIRGARNASHTEFYLARVEERYAGRQLVIELWDVGDVSGGSGTDNFSILARAGGVLDCDWSATNGNSGSGACTIVASNKVCNNELITLSIEIPGNYTCAGDECWWKLRYDYTDGYVKDTTTWTAFLSGNPLRIVE